MGRFRKNKDEEVKVEEVVEEVLTETAENTITETVVEEVLTETAENTITETVVEEVKNEEKVEDKKVEKVDGGVKSAKKTKKSSTLANFLY